MCGMMIITVPIPMLVSSFAITYKSKLWRSKISTKRRLLQGKVTKKTNILLNLASSSGMSGVLLKFPQLIHTVQVHHKDEVILTPSDDGSRQFYDSYAVSQVIVGSLTMLNSDFLSESSAYEEKLTLLLNVNNLKCLLIFTVAFPIRSLFSRRI